MKLEGHLYWFTEMGEISALCFWDKARSGYDAVVEFNEGDHITVFEKKGGVKWSGVYQKNRFGAAKINYAGIPPMGVDPFQWQKWCAMELPACIERKD